jgi:hypothetical protein
MKRKFDEHRAEHEVIKLMAKYKELLRRLE